MSFRAVLGWMLGAVAWLWLRTLRIELEVHPDVRALAEEEPLVFAFFHGKQWPLLAWRRRRPTVVMVSLSADGAMQSRALRVLGLDVVRGSSSRGGARGLAALVRILKRRTHDAAFAVDGPRGPYGVAKPGLALAATKAGARILPMGSAFATGQGIVFERAWDRFELAWPFARVAVVIGPPTANAHIGASIRRANERAVAILAAGASSVVRFPSI